MSVNLFISATFSEEMTDFTINDTTVLVHDGSGYIEGTVAYDNKTAKFIPASPLNHETTYSVKITTTVKDRSFYRNNMESDFTWSFTTECICIEKCDGEVVDIISTGSIRPYGLAFDGTNLWYAETQNDKIHGPITFDSPGNAPYGLTFGGTYLWNVDSIDKKIYKLDTSGLIIDFIDLPIALMTGLTFDGTYLWVASSNDDKIYKMDTNGNLLSSFSSPVANPTGLAFDGTYLWNADFEADKIYKLDTFGNVIDSFDSPGVSFKGSNGLTFDGVYLWVSEFYDKKIYKILVNESANACDCAGDSEPDGDVDGTDLAAHLSDSQGLPLETFARNYGRTNCP
jgi:sugar lactone lactonase YvrE